MPVGGRRDRGHLDLGKADIMCDIKLQLIKINGVLLKHKIIIESEILVLVFERSNDIFLISKSFLHVVTKERLITYPESWEGGSKNASAFSNEQQIRRWWDILR